MADETPRRGTHGNRLFQLCAVAILAAVVVFLFTDFEPISRKPPTEIRNRITCMAHLAEIHRALQQYKTSFGDNMNYPPHTGAHLLLCLAGRCKEPEKHATSFLTQQLLTDPDKTLLCPSSGNGSGTLDYRGPRQLIPADCPPSIPIACDKDLHYHGSGGCVLFSDGSVRFLPDDEFLMALQKTE